MFEHAQKAISLGKVSNEDFPSINTSLLFLEISRLDYLYRQMFQVTLPVR